MVQEADDQRLVEAEDNPVAGNLEGALVDDCRTPQVEDHQEDLGVGSRLVEEDSILLVVEEGRLEEGRLEEGHKADVEDRASVLVEDVLAEDSLQAGLLFVGLLVHSRDARQSEEHTHAVVYCMTCFLFCVCMCVDEVVEIGVLST
jgi:hypothetical protein